MREGRPSWTAAWVAWMRSLAEYLPPEERLALDPFGRRLAWPTGVRLEALPGVARALVAFPLREDVLSIQLRTRFLDDLVATYIASHGRQVVLLGAGFDARAARLETPAGTVFFEVDHPATQRVKRDLMGDAPRARYLAWDFEARALSGLPAALATLGHEAARPTLTIWEGVAMYLARDALDATVRAVRALSGPSSILAFNYLDARFASGNRHLERLAVRFVGEPFRSSFHPAELGAWLAERGFSLVEDRSYAELGHALLPASKERPSRRRRRMARAIVAS